jgi:hypothetical protein
MYAESGLFSSFAAASPAGFSFFFVESLGVFLPASFVGEAFAGSTVVVVGDDA